MLNFSKSFHENMVLVDYSQSPFCNQVNGHIEFEKTNIFQRAGERIILLILEIGTKILSKSRASNCKTLKELISANRHITAYEKTGLSNKKLLKIGELLKTYINYLKIKENPERFKNLLSIVTLYVENLKENDKLRLSDEHKTSIKDEYQIKENELEFLLEAGKIFQTPEVLIRTLADYFKPFDLLIKNENRMSLKEKLNLLKKYVGDVEKQASLSLKLPECVFINNYKILLNQVEILNESESKNSNKANLVDASTLAHKSKPWRFTQSSLTVEEARSDLSRTVVTIFGRQIQTVEQAKDLSKKLESSRSLLMANTSLFRKELQKYTNIFYLIKNISHLKELREKAHALTVSSEDFYGQMKTAVESGT